MKKLLLPLVCLVFLCGCWNYEDTNHRLIVAGAAVDLGENGETEITAEIVTFEQNDNTGAKSHLLTGKGSSVSEAFNDILKSAGKKLYWQHATVIVIGAEYAQNGIAELLDYVLNDHEMRMTLDFAVSGMKKGADVFELDAGDQQILSFAITSRIHESGQLGYCSRELAYQALNTYAENLRDISMPLVICGDKGALEVSGCAAFRGQKMIGTVSAVESQYLHMFNQTLQSIELQIQTQELKSSVNLGNIHSNIEISREGRNLIARVSLRANYEVLMSVENPPMDRQRRREKIEEIVKTQLRNGMRQTKKHLELMQCDLIGWGERFFRYDPEGYQLFSNEDVFNITPEIEISIELQAKPEGITGSTIDQEGG